MYRLLKIVLGGVLGAAAIAFLGAWLVLNASIFSDTRRTLVQDLLSEQIGQALIITDDVTASLGLTSRIHVLGARIPSENIQGLALAELAKFELDIGIIPLLQGEINIDNLRIEGLSVNLLSKLDGTNSWSERSALIAPVPSGERNYTSGILDFLDDKTASISRIDLMVEFETSGFVFDFDLNNLQLDQLEGGQLVSLVGDGAVNGEPFAIEGSYPRGQEFTTKVSIAQVALSYDGKPLPAAQGNGHIAQLTLDTGEFGEVLDTLRLEHAIEGRGQLSTMVTLESGVVTISDFDTLVELDGGQVIKASGAVDDLFAVQGADLFVDVDLFGKGNGPAKAHNFADLQLIGISAKIVGDRPGLEFERLDFETNAFDRELSHLGPVSIGRIMRTEAGELSFLDIDIQVGPADAPYLKATGNIRDTLEFEGVDFEGTLGAAASLILPRSEYVNAPEFGRVQADFAITDVSGFLTLTELHTYTQDTDLWFLESTLSVDQITTLDGSELYLNFDIPDGKAFLSALDLQPIDTGKVGVTLDASSQGSDMVIEGMIAVDKSQLGLSLDNVFAPGAPKIRGNIFSDLLLITDLKNAVASVKQVMSLGEADTRKIEEPLVLEKIEEPLVIAKPEEPLITGSADPEDKGEITDLFDMAEYLRTLDLQVAIDIAKIQGQAGVTSVASTLTVEDEIAQFGPLKFAYDGGRFDVGARMNLAKTPRLITVTGSTSGWELADILKEMGVDLDARGKLRADFNLTGQTRSVSAFINSMYGNVNASMGRGAIATSLLELAGLGIFPWLFSVELNRGYTNIVCAAAPVKVAAGKVTFNSAVIETERVQVVVAGSLDWKTDTISMRAEPRPVGRPWARSAWPINITGSLKHPQFDLRGRGKLPTAARGAGQMPANRTPCKADALQMQ